MKKQILLGLLLLVTGKGYTANNALVPAGAVAVQMPGHQLGNIATLLIARQFLNKEAVLADLKNARETEAREQANRAHVQDLERKNNRSWYGAVAEDYIAHPVCWA